MARGKRSELQGEHVAAPRKRAIDEGDANHSPPKRKRGRPRTASRKAYELEEQRVINENDSGSGTDVYDSGPASTSTSRNSKRVSEAAESSAAGAANHGSSTPRNRKARGTQNVETPSRSRPAVNGDTPQWRRNDRSARKKSARALIESVVTGQISDEDEDQNIAKEIYESSNQEDNDESDDAGEEAELHPFDRPQSTSDPVSKPSRARRKGSRARKKSPTPPRDLPPHELYFAQNRPGASKTSSNSLGALQMLTHEEYFSIYNDYMDLHLEDAQFLQEWHAKSFPQWTFELSQGFSVCLHGYGSKRSLMQSYAKYLYTAAADRPRHRIVIVNGYVRTISIREIFGTIGKAADSSYKVPAGNASVMLDNMKSILSSRDIHITVIFNSVDAPPLRKATTQSALAQLASHPSIQVICSVDTPDFSLLWDGGLRSDFNFAFHDCTTFAPYTAELDVVDDVHELLGRKATRVGGKERVAYVLRSLPENAKNLFRLLLGEVLATMGDEGVSTGENPGIEYRMLYNRAVEEFICSSEMAFRTLLKEFHDHQMITSRKDVLGTELLSIPFGKEELEAILEDLMS